MKISSILNMSNSSIPIIGILALTLENLDKPLGNNRIGLS
jgi:hypothetical protein